MSKFFMFGKYTSDGFRNMTSERTTRVREMVAQRGGKVCDAYALLGKFDIVFIVEQTSMPEAMQTAVALRHLTGISFSTYQAVPIEAFDKMLDELSTEVESARMEAHE
jgi:uncharacterized protein with GYD domain